MRCGDENRGTQWRRYPVNNDGEAASRRGQWTVETRRPWKRSSRIVWLLEVGTVSVAALRNATTGRDCSLNCSVAAAAVVCTHWTVCRLSCCRGSGTVRDLFKLLFGRRLWTCNVMPLMRDGTRRDPSSTDDLAGLEALFYWTHLCNRV